MPLNIRWAIDTQNWGIGRREEDALSRADPPIQLYLPFWARLKRKDLPDRLKELDDHLPQGGREEKENVT